MVEIDEPDRSRSPDELLNWLCWSRALDGETFYPPKESVDNCMREVRGQYDFYEGDLEENLQELMRWNRNYGKEEGSHLRALDNAIEFFDDLHRRGYDPVARAEQEIEDAREDDLDLPPIDWGWLEDSRYEGEIP